MSKTINRYRTVLFVLREKMHHANGVKTLLEYKKNYVHMGTLSFLSGKDERKSALVAADETRDKFFFF